MLTKLRRRAWMIVLGVVVALMILVPIIVGGEAREQDNEAKASLRTALAAARAIAERSGGEYAVDADGTPIAPTDLATEDGSLEFSVQGSKNVIGVYVENENRSITLFTQSESGKWFGIVGFVDGEPQYCSSSGPRGVDDSVQCQGRSW